MKKLIFLIPAIIILCSTSLLGCLESSPIDETMYLGADPPIILVEDGLVYLEFRPDLDFTTITALGKPTWVTRGAFGGFSLPIYVGGQNEELFFNMCVPNRYDGVSDGYIHIHCYLDTANTDKNFNLEVGWNYFTAVENTVPDTFYTITSETATGTALQYQSFQIDLPIDYDVRPDDTLTWDDNMGFRLRRIDASADETAGEIVITHFGVIFRRDKLGSPTP